MNDRELLELAAKAAKIETTWDQLRGSKTGVVRLSTGRIWNPLNDDGDALRLAVTLRLHLRYFDDEREPKRVIVDNHPGNVEIYTDDPFAATRRAIVRAAAEIGRNE